MRRARRAPSCASYGGPRARQSCSAVPLSPINYDISQKETRIEYKSNLKLIGSDPLKLRDAELVELRLGLSNALHAVRNVEITN